MATITISPEHRLELRCADAEFRAATAELRLLELQVLHLQLVLLLQSLQLMLHDALRGEQRLLLDRERV
mgnify:CR=1 FL=1